MSNAELIHESSTLEPPNVNPPHLNFHDKTTSRYAFLSILSHKLFIALIFHSLVSSAGKFIIFNLAFNTNAFSSKWPPKSANSPTLTRPRAKSYTRTSTCTHYRLRNQYIPTHPLTTPPQLRVRTSHRARRCILVKPLSPSLLLSTPKHRLLHTRTTSRPCPLLQRPNHSSNRTQTSFRSRLPPRSHRLYSGNQHQFQ